MKSGAQYPVLVHTQKRSGHDYMTHVVIESDPEFLEEIDLVGFDTFIKDAEDCDPPDDTGLWTADFQYTEEDDGVRMHWKAIQVSDWVRLTATQADALAQGKPFAEVVAS